MVKIKGIRMTCLVEGGSSKCPVRVSFPLSVKIQKSKPRLDDTERRTSKQDKRGKEKRRTVKTLVGITMNDITVL